MILRQGSERRRSVQEAGPGSTNGGRNGRTAGRSEPSVTGVASCRGLGGQSGGTWEPSLQVREGAGLCLHQLWLSLGWSRVVPGERSQSSWPATETGRRGSGARENPSAKERRRALQAGLAAMERLGAPTDVCCRRGVTLSSRSPAGPASWRAGRMACWKRHVQTLTRFPQTNGSFSS